MVAKTIMPTMNANSDAMTKLRSFKRSRSKNDAPWHRPGVRDEEGEGHHGGGCLELDLPRIEPVELLAAAEDRSQSGTDFGKAAGAVVRPAPTNSRSPPSG